MIIVIAILISIRNINFGMAPLYAPPLTRGPRPRFLALLMTYMLGAPAPPPPQGVTGCDITELNNPLPFSVPLFFKSPKF